MFSALLEPLQRSIGVRMSLLYALEPESQREERVPIPLWQARLAVVVEGCYFLVPACACDSQGRPLAFPLEASTGATAMAPG